MKDPWYDYKNKVLKNKLNIKDEEKLKQAESDFAITRINEIFKSSYFLCEVSYLNFLHKHIFGDIYDFAGIYRTTPLFKEEKILQYLSVDYTSPENIESELNSIFESIKNNDLNTLNTEEKIDYITHVISDIWKVHPFREGNTRTVLVFLREYLKSYDIHFSKNLFKKESNFKYMRDAFVASSFEAEDLGVNRNYMYIRRVISDIIIDDMERKKTL